MRKLLLALVLVGACSPNPDTSTQTPKNIPVATQGAPSPAGTPVVNPCIQNDMIYCALNSDVVGNILNDPNGNLGNTICKKNWTSTIRPPRSFTDQLKMERMGVHGYDLSNISNYELDHRMPLELGGAPGSPKSGLDWENVNLSLESPASPNPKDQDETALKDAVCRGSMTLAQARLRLVSTWLLPGDRYKK
jgi:hypothetical protein